MPEGITFLSLMLTRRKLNPPKDVTHGYQRILTQPSNWGQTPNTFAVYDLKLAIPVGYLDPVP